MQETQVRSLGRREDALEESMATHSSILAWRIPWTEEPCKLQPTGSQRVRHDLATKQQQQQVNIFDHLFECVAFWFFATIWTIAHQAPLSVGFPRQEYWSGLLFPPPGDIPDSRTEPASPALAGRFFTIWAIGLFLTLSKSYLVQSSAICPVLCLSTCSPRAASITAGFSLQRLLPGVIIWGARSHSDSGFQRQAFNILFK